MTEISIWKMKSKRSAKNRRGGGAEVATSSTGERTGLHWEMIVLELGRSQLPFFPSSLGEIKLKAGWRVEAEAGRREGRREEREDELELIRGSRCLDRVRLT